MNESYGFVIMETWHDACFINNIVINLMIPLCGGNMIYCMCG